jgi:hypothetical protein
MLNFFAIAEYTCMNQTKSVQHAAHSGT